jgi:ornithine decarboxylase
MATRFNGYGVYTDVILQDEPIYSIYTHDLEAVARNA